MREADCSQASDKTVILSAIELRYGNESADSVSHSGRDTHHNNPRSSFSQRFTENEKSSTASLVSPRHSNFVANEKSKSSTETLISPRRLQQKSEIPARSGSPIVVPNVDGSENEADVSENENQHENAGEIMIDPVDDEMFDDERIRDSHLAASPGLSKFNDYVKMVLQKYVINN